MTKVYAKYIGATKSEHYSKGKKYHLSMAIIGNGSIEIHNEKEEADSRESYASLHSFLSNWKVLG